MTSKGGAGAVLLVGGDPLAPLGAHGAHGDGDLGLQVAAVAGQAAGGGLVVDGVAAQADVDGGDGPGPVGVDEVRPPQVDLVDQPLGAAGVDELAGGVVLQGLDGVLGQLDGLAFQEQAGGVGRERVRREEPDGVEVGQDVGADPVGVPHGVQAGLDRDDGAGGLAGSGGDGLLPFLEQGFLPQPEGLDGRVEIGYPVVYEGLAPGRGEPRQLGVVEPGAECVVDAAGDPGRVGGQGAADGGDAGQVALGIVGDELAHPGGQVLAAQFEGEGAGVAGDDPLVVEEERGRADRAADHLHRVGVVVGVVRESAAGEGDDEGDALLAAAGPAGALGVVAGPGRDVAQDDRQQLAQVDAEFQGHGADQDVQVAVLEPVLDRLPRFQGDLAGVLGGQDDNRLRGGGQQPLVIVRVAAPGAHDPLAVERGAPVPRGAGGLDGPAGPAAVQVRRRRAGPRWPAGRPAAAARTAARSRR